MTTCQRNRTTNPTHLATKQKHTRVTHDLHVPEYADDGGNVYDADADTKDEAAEGAGRVS